MSMLSCRAVPIKKTDGYDYKQFYYTGAVQHKHQALDIEIEMSYEHEGSR